MRLFIVRFKFVDVKEIMFWIFIIQHYIEVERKNKDMKFCIENFLKRLQNNNNLT